MKIGIEIERSEMVMTNDGGRIPAQHHDCVDVFSKVKAERVPPRRPTDHAINLEPRYKLPYGQFYNLSVFKLMTVKDYIETNLASAFIQPSSSPATEPILFAKKKD